jgi:hypothetical protein
MDVIRGFQIPTLKHFAHLLTLINYQPPSFLCCFLHGTALWPHRGGSQHREPQNNFSNIFEKVIWSRNRCFFLRISIIFCMRETVIISNGSRILPCFIGPKNDLKTTIYFFYILLCFFFWEPLGISLRGATVGPLHCKTNGCRRQLLACQRRPLRTKHNLDSRTSYNEVSICQWSNESHSGLSRCRIACKLWVSSPGTCTSRSTRCSQLFALSAPRPRLVGAFVYILRRRGTGNLCTARLHVLYCQNLAGASLSRTPHISICISRSTRCSQYQLAPWTSLCHGIL